jgi:uncharacterized protein YhdP
MKDIAGDVFWDTGGKGFVRADLKRLLLPAANQKGGSLDLNDDDSLLNSLPGLDIHVGDFAIGERHFGRLDVKAHNDGGLWLMDKVNIDNPDGNLQGKGQWKSGSAARTQLEFELEARDVGKLLDRLGFPGTIKRGTAHLKGDLAWPGAPTGLEYAGLSGRLDLDASRGQFAKVDPGVGKLLGLLSLQSLPRRITLDFRDIFSEGFAFDAIDARLDIRNGVIRTREDLHIDGPAGRILMQGEADLRQESQSLLVSVQPEVAGVAALGAVVMAHPVAGVATIIANKVFQNPLNKVFGFQYRVSGSWADPQVEKVGTSVGAAGAGPAPAGKENK